MNYIKTSIKVISLLLIVFVSSSCNVTDSGKDKISVSILPQKYFVEAIAGDLFEVNVLIPPGASPATYEPSPAQIKKTEESNIYFKIGYIEFEKSWMKKFEALNEEMIVINTSTGIDLIDDGGHWHGDHYHAGAIEPHVWTSPKAVNIIAQNILQTLVHQYPEHKDIFLKNYEQLALDINEMDGIASKAFNNLTSNKFLIYHPALSYLARDYGLVQIAMEHQGKEPSSKYLKRLIDQAREENIKVVLIQKQFDQNNAKALANELNAEIISIDPLAENWVENTKLIITILSQNLN